MGLVLDCSGGQTALESEPRAEFPLLLPSQSYGKSMHHALCTAELLAPISSQDLDTVSLLRAALTCQAWKEPALDQLWRSLESPSLLIRVLGIRDGDAGDSDPEVRSVVLPKFDD